MGEIYTVPLVCTRGLVFFPNQQYTIDIGRKESIRSIDHSQAHNTYVLIILVSMISLNMELYVRS